MIWLPIIIVAVWAALFILIVKSDRKAHLRRRVRGL